MGNMNDIPRAIGPEGLADALETRFGAGAELLVLDAPIWREVQRLLVDRYRPDELADVLGVVRALRIQVPLGSWTVAGHAEEPEADVTDERAPSVVGLAPSFAEGRNLGSRAVLAAIVEASDDAWVRSDSSDVAAVLHGFHDHDGIPFSHGSIRGYADGWMRAGLIRFVHDGSAADWTVAVDSAGDGVPLTFEAWASWAVVTLDELQRHNDETEPVR